MICHNEIHTVTVFRDFVVLYMVCFYQLLDIYSSPSYPVICIQYIGKLVGIFQTTFSNSFSCVKLLYFTSNPRKLIPCIQIATILFGWDNALAPRSRKDYYINQWWLCLCITWSWIASLGFDLIICVLAYKVCCEILSCIVLGADLTYWGRDKNCCHFADNILRCLFVNEKCCVTIEIYWCLFLTAQLTIIQYWFS